MNLAQPARRDLFSAAWSLAGLIPLLCSIYGYAGTSTTTSLTLSSTSVSSGTAITLTAPVLAGATQVYPGTVLFCNASASQCADSAIVGRGQLTVSGTAVLKTIPAIGPHSYKAIFQGTTTYTTSTSPNVSMTVTGLYTTTTAIASSGSAGAYTLTGTSTSLSSATTYPSGTVTFKDASNGNYVLGSGTLGSNTAVQAFPLISTTSVGSTPRRTASADFNGDGRPDVVIASQNSNNISILLSNGDGTFTAASGSPIATGNTVVAVATGDFNGDGKVDIAALDYSDNNIAILLGNGDGTFQSPTYLTGFNSPSMLAVADLNGDGNLDLAVTSQNSNVVCDYLGNGSGGFGSSNCFTTGSSPYSVVIADLNGDGFPDLVVGNANASTITVLLGDGTGNFTAASGSPVTVGPQAQNLVAADINGDGKVDIVISDRGDANLGILLGNGNGTFGTLATYALAAGTKEIATADFNLDGYADLVVCNYSLSTAAIILGNGNGTFGTANNVSVGSSGCSGVSIGDFNGDGLPDVEFSLQGNVKSTVLLNQIQHSATASLSGISIPGHGTHNITAVYAGDSSSTTSTSSFTALTASPIATALTLSAAPSSSNYSQQIILTAVLSPYMVGNLTTAGETITFKSGGTTLGTGTLSSGVATLNVTSLAVGTASLTASYVTDLDFLASTSNTVNYTVAKSTPVITWSTPSAITYGTALSSTQLNASSGGVAGTFIYMPASGTVLNAGSGQTLSVAFTPTDPSSYNNASGTTTITVNKAASTITLATSAASSGYGSTVTFTATLPTGASGTVTFLDGGSSVGAGTISSTTATFSIATLSVGSHAITASWPGNANYLTSTSVALMQTIVKSAVTLSEVSLINPSLYGDTIVLSISATGSGVTPTGTVTLTDSSTTLTTLTLSGAGSASYITSLLSAGNHALTVTYNGDGNYF